jgi:hypothetical protein
MQPKSWVWNNLIKKKENYINFFLKKHDDFLNPWPDLKHPIWTNHEVQFSINQILKEKNWKKNFNYTKGLKYIN